MRLARLAGVVVVMSGLIGCAATGQEPANGRPQSVGRTDDAEVRRRGLGDQ